MKLQDALELLQKGDAMCRESWSIEDGYIVMMLGMKHVWKIVLQPAPNAGNYIFSLEDMLSSDWRKFALPKEEIDAGNAKEA